MDLPAPTVCILFFAHFLLKSPLWGLLLSFQRTMILLWVITRAPQNTTSLTPVVNARRLLAWIFRPRRSSESRTKECSNANPKEGWSHRQLHVDGVAVRWWPLGLELDEMLWPGSQTAFLDLCESSCQVTFGQLAVAVVQKDPTLSNGCADKTEEQKKIIFFKKKTLFNNESNRQISSRSAINSCLFG